METRCSKKRKDKGSGAKDVEEPANRGEVVRVRVAKDDHIIGIEGYARSCVTVGQAMKEAKLNCT